MFEMKYDKNGTPIKNETYDTEPNQEANESLPQVDESPEQPEPEQEEQNAAGEEQEQQEQSDSSEAAQELQKNNKEENFRKLREKTERLEKERDEAIRLAEDYYKKVSSSTPQKQEEPPEEEDDSPLSISDDDLVEGKHLNKFQKKILRLEKKIQQYEQRTQEEETYTKVKSDYNDFNTVVSRENVKKLRELDPDLAEAIARTPDMYKQASLAYKMIKKLGIAKDEYSQDREIAQRNSNKPKPSAVVSPQTGDTPLTKANAFANGLTDDLKKQLRLEMEQARRSS